MGARASSPLSGRRAQAARNDQRVFEAARAVFTANPAAPIAAVAERADVGISALYRRYRSKEDLLQRLCLDGLRRYIAETEAALADEGDPWTSFATFMVRCLDAGTGSLTLRLAGAFQTTEELNRAGQEAHDLTLRLLGRARDAGVLRPDIGVSDLTLLFEQLQSIRVGDERRTAEIRRRYLALLLVAVQAPAARPLPGPPPDWEEITRRYAAPEG